MPPASIIWCRDVLHGIVGGVVDWGKCDQSMPLNRPAFFPSKWLDEQHPDAGGTKTRLKSPHDVDNSKRISFKGSCVCLRCSETLVGFIQWNPQITSCLWLGMRKIIKRCSRYSTWPSRMPNSAVLHEKSSALLKRINIDKWGALYDKLENDPRYGESGKSAVLMKTQFGFGE